MAYGEGNAEIEDFDRDADADDGLVYESDIANASDHAALQDLETSGLDDLPTSEDDSDDEGTIVAESTRDLFLDLPFSDVEKDMAGGSENESGTVTDDYEADCSEAETTKVNKDGYEEVSHDISELSLTDTLICVGFGYAWLYI